MQIKTEVNGNCFVFAHLQAKEQLEKWNFEKNRVKFE